MPPPPPVLSQSVEQTRGLGQRLAGWLEAGDVVSVEGPLGVGKTAFIGGMARGLGCHMTATSPSFALVHIYPGPTPLVHADLYRVESLAEAEDLALDEIQSQNNAVLTLEWAEPFSSLLPDERIVVRIDFADRDRQIMFEGIGRRAATIVERVLNVESGH